MVSSDNIVHIWNWRAGESVNSLEDLEESVLSTFLKGELVFYVLENQMLKIWNWRTTSEVTTLQAFSGQVLQVVNQNILLSSLGNQLYLWNLRTGELITNLYAGNPIDYSPDDAIQNAITTSNFERLIVGTTDGNILFLKPNPALQNVLRACD